MAGEFNRLLKGAIRSVAAYEDKSPSEIDAELAEAVGLAPVTIRDYKGDRAPSSRIVVAGLARILVRRAYLDREWLVRFLNAAHYSLPESLINELFPDVAVPAPGPDILPPASYSHFVMRQQVFDEVVEALRQTTSILVITGLGGMGKTSLAREVAARCLQNASDLPQFEAVIWVSDAEQPGTTTLNIALDAIATTLDYPGITQLNYKTKKREVEKLLARQRSLLVIDSFETITDGELFDWLLSLPKSTKAIITTREYRREFRECRHVELRAMNETEAYQFIDLHLRLRGLQHLVNDRDQLNPLIAATGGNPKAILISLGRLKYEPIKDVIDDLRTGQGEPFDDLFKRCWDQLDQAARRVLLVMPLFRGSASKEALQTVADIQGFVFNRVVERLADLALLDVHQKDITSHPRYTLHPLVHAFVIAKLQKHSQLEEEMRSRWVEWVEDYVLQVGWAWDDLSRLKIAEAEEENIYAAINWAFRSHNDTATINIAQGIDHYYYVRGLWDKKKEVDKWRIEAAQRLGVFDKLK